jgi:uncharacterized membrane protein YbhN (UPF0104 family)
MTPQRRSFLFRAALTVLTVGAVGYYAWHGRQYFQGGWAWDWKWAFIAVALAPTLILGRALKWWILARPLDASVTYPQSLRSYLGCLPLGVVSPGRLGEYARCFYLPQTAFHGMAGAGRVFLDNWTDMVGVLVWAALGYVSLTGSDGFLPAFLSVSLLLPLRFWMRVGRRMVGAFPRLWGARDALLRGIPRPDQLPPWSYGAALGSSVTVWGLEWLQAAALLRFLGNAPPNFIALGGLLALVALANSVQVTLAGLGVREGLAAYLLSNAGIDFRAALVAAFCQTLLNQLLPALAGLGVKPFAVGPFGPRAAKPQGAGEAAATPPAAN